MLWHGLMQHVRGCWVDEKGDFYGGARVEFSDDGWKPLNPRASAHKRSAYTWKVRTQKCILTETRRDGSKCQFEMALGRDGRLVVRHADQKMQWKLRRVVHTDSPKTAEDSLLCAGLSASGHRPPAKPTWSDVASHALAPQTRDTPSSEAGDNDFGVPRCRCGIALMPGQGNCSQCSREATGTALATASRGGSAATSLSGPTPASDGEPRRASREEQPQHLSIWPWEPHPIPGSDASSAGTPQRASSSARRSAGPARSSPDAKALPEREGAGAAHPSPLASGDLEGTRRVIRPAPEPPHAAPALPTPTASLLQALRASSPSQDERRPGTAPGSPNGADALPGVTASLLQALRATSPSPEERWQQERAEARQQAMMARQARLQQEKAELLMRSQRIDRELQDIHVCVRDPDT